MQRTMLCSLVAMFFITTCCMSDPTHSRHLNSEVTAQETKEKTSSAVITGAQQLDAYLPLLRDKSVAVVVNQTSIVDPGKHLVDVLLQEDIDVKKIFSPEHGFRGTEGAGEMVRSGVDASTGLMVVSLYGKDKKPSKEHLLDVDVVIFDIQDVGARFYTYISTMHYIMEACAENRKPLIVLDRPNPNGHYVDGPVLDMKLQSFVGMHPIPIVHGLTVGELATMINGEGWLPGQARCNLTVIPCKNYTHKTPYSLPVKPSPNLPNDQSIALYPSLCLFEGTVVSVGRGTEAPFQIIGHPQFPGKDFSFTPQSVAIAKTPPFVNQRCFGTDLRNAAQLPTQLSLKEVILYYQALKDKGEFFNAFWTKLAGTEELKKQIEAGMNEEQIRTSWQKGLQEYKSRRKKYLLYPDFE